MHTDGSHSGTRTSDSYNGHVVSIDHAYLIRLASDPNYAWMSSLRTLSTFHKRETSRCCGRTYISPVPIEAVRAVAKNPAFLDDLWLLKKKLGIKTMIVNVEGCRTTLS